MRDDPGDLLTVPVTVDLLRGCLDAEPTADGLLPHRLPRWARAQNSDPQLAAVEVQPAGVRLAVRTAATRIELDTSPTTFGYVGAPRRPRGVYDLVVDGRLVSQATASGGRTLTVDLATGTSRTEEGPVCTLVFGGLPAGDKHVEVWLPHNEQTALLALRADAPLAPAPADRRPRWVHHGSSISQGSNAASPTGTWPATAARLVGLDLVNLGFGGGAMLDPFVARTMGGTAADLLSVEIGINLVTGDVMRMRAFGPAVHGFLDTLREAHPDTPVVVLSPLLCPIHEHTPGPGSFDVAALGEGRLAFTATGDPADVARGRLTLSTVRTELARIVEQRAAEDPHLHLVDGRSLYGEDDAVERPLPDRLHPDAATHRVVGERFAAMAAAELPSPGT
ncbi:GDSL-type esterase/lipase family protein [Aquipuribacter sp. SD81]|uniref:GDSL-type esterase/lipase family protein n=1 Tax=Aquipuribacter sp. SD81 TaxID=3127703 RepID=UPI003019C2F7